MNHPLHGTCVPGCPLYGRCHCGCGGATTITSRKRPGGTKGHPHVYLAGHNPHHVRWGVPYFAVRSDLEAAIRLCGTARGVARLVGRHESWVAHVRAGRIRRVSVAAANRIAEAVRGTRSSVPEPLVLRNRKNKRAERARDR